MIRQTLLTLAIALAAAAPPAAHAKVGPRIDMCEVSTDYSLALGADAVTFSRDSGSPRTVVMRRGTLRVDGREIALRPEDRVRIASYEATVRELVPEAKALALDALAIAFEAVEQVLRTFVEPGEADRVVARLADTRNAAARRVRDTFDHRPWNESEFERLIEDTVAELVPEIAAVAAGAAIRIAFSGDVGAAADLERRASRLEHTIEQEVDKRTRELERRAEALCPLVADLEALEATLAVRIDDRPLDLITNN